MSDTAEDNKEKELEFVKETPAEKKWRMASILSYIIILIGFGIPIWWHTTKVYRANLPLDDMLLMESSESPPLSILIHAATASRSQLLSEEIQSLLGQTVSVKIHNDKLTLPISNNEKDIENAAKNTRTQPGQILLAEFPKATKSLILSSRRVIYFKSDVSGYRLAMFLENWPGVELKTALSDPNMEEIKTKVMRPFAAGPRYDVLVTLVNPEPQSLTVEWDIQKAIHDYLQPFINSISHITNFTIKSQWLYLVELGIKPRQVDDHFALSEVFLPHIISPLEKKLSSLVSKDPCINLVVYTPSCKNSPLYIYNRQGVRNEAPVDAFISPRWGGLQINNPSCPNDTYDLNSQNQIIMNTFITQLHTLLGIPDLKSKILDEIVQTGPTPSQLQKDYLMRYHTLEYLAGARLSLRSLAQLLSEISNIVIRDDIAESVHESIDSLQAAQQFLVEGQVGAAFTESQKAFLKAEEAFSDPSLLALLYFPDDQKYAVYIPLFLPIMIPVVISIGPLTIYASKPESEKRNTVFVIIFTVSFIAYFVQFEQVFKILEDQKLL